VSASHQVRQNSAAADSSTTPPATIETVPTVALIAVAIPTATSKPPDLLDAVHRGVRTNEPAQQQRAHDDLRHVARLLAEEASDRERAVVEQELPVDDELGEQHAGPPAESPQVERGDPEPRGGQIADTEAV